MVIFLSFSAEKISRKIGKIQQLQKAFKTILNLERKLLERKRTHSIIFLLILYFCFFSFVFFLSVFCIFVVSWIVCFSKVAPKDSVPDYWDSREGEKTTQDKERLNWLAYE